MLAVGIDHLCTVATAAALCQIRLVLLFSTVQQLEHKITATPFALPSNQADAGPTATDGATPPLAAGPDTVKQPRQWLLRRWLPAAGAEATCGEPGGVRTGAGDASGPGIGTWSLAHSHRK